MGSIVQALTEAGETVYDIGRIEEGTRGCTVIGSKDAWSGHHAWTATHNA